MDGPTNKAILGVESSMSVAEEKKKDCYRGILGVGYCEGSSANSQSRSFTNRKFMILNCLLFATLCGFSILPEHAIGLGEPRLDNLRQRGWTGLAL